MSKLLKFGASTFNTSSYGAKDCHFEDKSQGAILDL